MANIRITKTQRALEIELLSGRNEVLSKWLKLSIEDLEYRLRYSKPEETQVIQGALRALYDIKAFT